MASHAVRPKIDAKPYNGEAPSFLPAVETLARDLARSVAEQYRSQIINAAKEGDSRLLLDLEVEGLRCLLFTAPKSNGNNHLSLSPREREIARMVAKGHPNKTIAGVLDISTWTVCTHLRRVFAKLGVNSRAAMVARLLECNLLAEGKNRFGASRASPE